MQRVRSRHLAEKYHEVANIDACDDGPGQILLDALFDRRRVAQDLLEAIDVQVDYGLDKGDRRGGTGAA